jgi:hypothetical protein
MNPLTAAITNPKLKQLAAHVASAREQASRVAGGLSAAQLAWRPAPQRWGVGDCLEHLIVSHEAMAPAMKSKLEAMAREHPGGHYEPWKHTLMGGLLIRSIDPATGKRKLKTQKVFFPVQPVRADALDRFLRTLDDLDEMIRRSDGLPVGKVKMSSPALRLIRYSIGDALAILALHALRHVGQAERVRAEPGFPAS